MSDSAVAPILEGKKAQLRPFTEDDIGPAYLGWLNDLEVTQFSNQRFRRHDAVTSRAYLDTFAHGPNLFLGIERVADGRLVGTMTAYVAEPHGTADIGILLGDRATWGTGIAADAWRLLAGWLLGDRGLRKLTCGTLDTNAAMKRLAERCGMLPDGRRVAQELVVGTPVDIVYYARFGDR